MKLLNLEVLESLRQELHALGVRSEIEKGSVCVYRPVRDRHSAATLGMASAVCLTYTDHLAHKIYCVEQYDETKALKKLSVKVANSCDVILRQYDRDTKRGPHIHHFISGQKQNEHLPFSGNISDIAKDIFSLMAQV